MIIEIRRFKYNHHTSFFYFLKASLFFRHKLRPKNLGFELFFSILAFLVKNLKQLGLTIF